MVCRMRRCWRKRPPQMPRINDRNLGNDHATPKIARPKITSSYSTASLGSNAAVVARSFSVLAEAVSFAYSRSSFVQRWIGHQRHGGARELVDRYWSLVQPDSSKSGTRIHRMGRMRQIRHGLCTPRQ